MGEKYQEIHDAEQNKIDIVDLLENILKRSREIWWLFFLLVLLGIGAGFLREKRNYHETYKASATFIVFSGDQSYAVSDYYNRVSTEQINTTFPYIMTSGALNKVVAADLGLDYVPGQISAQKLGDTNLFQIDVIASNGQLAYDILQSVIENYPQVAKYVIGDTRLEFLDETGVPESPVAGPGYRRAMLKGGIAGFLVSLLIAGFLALMRNTVKNEDDLKKFLNIRYLTGIPLIYFKKRSNGQKKKILTDNSSVPDIYTEAMEAMMIRVERAMKEKKMKTLLVTSALPGEGKTTTAVNLAFLLAQNGRKVLLIDGDLRNPSVAEVLSMKNPIYGLKDVLSGEKEADEVISRYKKDSELYVLAGGSPVQEIQKFYSDNRLKRIIDEYREQMDFIVIDTPPCAMMHDTALIAENVEAGVFVIRQDYAGKEKILTGVEVLAQSGLVMIGSVINGITGGIGGYGYGRYGYGKYGYGRYGYGRYGYGKKEKTAGN